jgi:hypothetical protein
MLQRLVTCYLVCEKYARLKNYVSIKQLAEASQKILFTLTKITNTKQRKQKHKPDNTKNTAC